MHETLAQNPVVRGVLDRPASRRWPVVAFAIRMMIS